jgi:hypothetical protein
LPHPPELRCQIPVKVERLSMVGEQPLHPVAHPRAVLLRQLELAVQVTPVFILQRGHTNHAPYRLRTSRQMARQQIE